MTTSLKVHQAYMALALEQAQQAQQLGEVPIGAVLVSNHQVIAQSHNRSIVDHDASGHAEINVLRQAGQLLNNYRLVGSMLYVTLEPCAMCFGAMIQARVSHLIFGANDPKTGVCGGCMNLIEQPCFNHKIQMTSGIMSTECSQLLSNFFKQKRQDKVKL